MHLRRRCLIADFEPEQRFVLRLFCFYASSGCSSSSSIAMNVERRIIRDYGKNHRANRQGTQAWQPQLGSASGAPSCSPLRLLPI